MTFKLSSKAKTGIKLLFSIGLLYHLGMIWLMPISSSFIGRRLGAYFLPYANTIGMNTGWNFFSPDPANTIYYEYTVRFQDELDQDIQPPFRGVLPEEREAIVTDSSRRRFLYAVRFLMLEPSRIEELMAPWLCRQHPGSTKVNIKQVIEQVPSLDLAMKLNSEEAHLRTEAKAQYVSYSCARKNPEAQSEAGSHD